MQTRRKGPYNAELTLSHRLYVKPLITPITAIDKKMNFSHQSQVVSKTTEQNETTGNEQFSYTEVRGTVLGLEFET